MKLYSELCGRIASDILCGVSFCWIACHWKASDSLWPKLLNLKSPPPPPPPQTPQTLTLRRIWTSTWGHILLIFPTITKKSASNQRNLAWLSCVLRCAVCRSYMSLRLICLSVSSLQHFIRDFSAAFRWGCQGPYLIIFPMWLAKIQQARYPHKLSTHTQTHTTRLKESFYPNAIRLINTQHTDYNQDFPNVLHGRGEMCPLSLRYASVSWASLEHPLCLCLHVLTLIQHVWMCMCEYRKIKKSLTGACEEMLIWIWCDL